MATCELTSASTDIIVVPTDHHLEPRTQQGQNVVKAAGPDYVAHKSKLLSHLDRKGVCVMCRLFTVDHIYVKLYDMAAVN